MLSADGGPLTLHTALEQFLGELRQRATLDDEPEPVRQAVESAITRTDASVTLDLEAISGSYTGVMNKEGTELVGTFRQGERTAPLTFRRAEGKK